MPDNGSWGAVVIQNPNFFGQIERVDEFTNWAHGLNAMVIGCINPITLGLLKPPSCWGESGADIVVGEGQPLGIPLAGGGPYLGLMACKDSLKRQMPGRIVSKTDRFQWQRGFRALITNQRATYSSRQSNVQYMY